MSGILFLKAAKDVNILNDGFGYEKALEVLVRITRKTKRTEKRNHHHHHHGHHRTLKATNSANHSDDESVNSLSDSLTSFDSDSDAEDEIDDEEDDEEDVRKEFVWEKDEGVLEEAEANVYASEVRSSKSGESELLRRRASCAPS